MRLTPRSTSLLLAVTLAFAACQQPAHDSGTAADTITRTEILWDEWGVPHIFAPDTAGLFYANGWAQAKSHGDLLLRLIGQARGRAAEYWGEKHLDSDRWVHTVGIPPRAESWMDAQSPRFEEALDAFARGINDYASRHADKIDDDVEVVLPVVPSDVLAHLQRVLHFTFVFSPQDLRGAERDFHAGSNAWAIHPERSASGHAMLVANPHLPWFDLFTWFELQLVSPEVNVSGAALVGNPFAGIGFNDHLGWTHTVNTHDGADLYELELADGGYRWDGEVRAFETERRTLKVKQDDGHREEELEIRRSVHGPVVVEADGKALALRVVGLEDANLFEQYWDMARATNLEEFEAAQKRLQMPMFTTMYADRDGHILHLFGGRTPVRPEGDWSFWSGIVPGTSSSTLWTETHPYGELPKALDPPSGWLQNANDPPWTTTFPETLDADAFPAYMAPRFMHFRAQQSAKLLMDDDSITFEELVAYKHSSEMRLAERVLDDVIRATQAHGTERARRASEVFVEWDRTADAEARGAVLFQFFAEEMRDGLEFAESWSESDPLETPDGFADPEAAAAALDRAAERVESTYGALDVPWGEVFRLRRGDYDLPANGGPGSLGIFRVVNFRPDGDLRTAFGGETRTAFAGDSYVAAIEFSDPIRAVALLSYGNASQPGSPHVGDQLELFAKKQLRPVWRSREEIEAHLEEREEFQEALQ